MPSPTGKREVVDLDGGEFELIQKPPRPQEEGVSWPEGPAVDPRGRSRWKRRAIGRREDLPAFGGGGALGSRLGRHRLRPRVPVIGVLDDVLALGLCGCGSPRPGRLRLRHRLIHGEKKGVRLTPSLE